MPCVPPLHRIYGGIFCKYGDGSGHNCFQLKSTYHWIFKLHSLSIILELISIARQRSEEGGLRGNGRPKGVFAVHFRVWGDRFSARRLLCFFISTPPINVDEITYTYNSRIFTLLKFPRIILRV